MVNIFLVDSDPASWLSMDGYQMNRLYRAHEFATLAGVTVRALHHYDRIGLLKAQRSRSGHRLYTAVDLERLEQIAALKFLGIPLKEIKALLQSNPLTLLESLRLQLGALSEKREQIDRAIHAIDQAEKLVRVGLPSDAVLRKIIKAVETPATGHFMKKYYTEEAWAKRGLIIEQASAQTLEGYRQAWKQLFLEVEAALDLPPASEGAQLLAQRWVLLGELVTGGDAEIKAGGVKAWKDHRNWPVPEQDAVCTRFGLDPGSDRNVSMTRVEKVATFIGQAIGSKYYGALNSIRFARIDGQFEERSQPWVELFRDVEAALGEDPASVRAQALAARWTALVQEKKTPAPRVDNFRDVLQQKWPQDASMVVVNQISRLYRIEQVSKFLEKALAHGSSRQNSALG
jgi:MerR family transcriptional regulator, thiopeptide resistance regulator